MGRCKEVGDERERFGRMRVWKLGETVGETERRGLNELKL